MRAQADGGSAAQKGGRRSVDLPRTLRVEAAVRKGPGLGTQLLVHRAPIARRPPDRRRGLVNKDIDALFKRSDERRRAGCTFEHPATFTAETHSGAAVEAVAKLDVAPFLTMGTPVIALWET